MHRLLAKLFIKDYANIDNSRVRNAYGTMSSIFGIICNSFLATVKIVIGSIFMSIAMVADGINNFTDMTSSGISLIGFRMSNKPADSKHPYGHARIEYISSMLIAIIIIIAGVQLGITSVQSIIKGNSPSIDNLVLIFLGVSIIVKAYMAYFYHRNAVLIKSNTLKAVCVDSINDVVATTVVLISALITRYTSVNTDGYAGVLVSAYILIAGVKLAIETLSPLLGEKPNKDLVVDITKKIGAYPAILGIHDLIAHNYGANKYFVTLHAEVDSSVDIICSHELIDDIERELSSENVHVVIHMDPIVINDELCNDYRCIVTQILLKIDPNLTFHDFRMVKGHNRHNLIFDIVSPDRKQTQELLSQLINDALTDMNTCCRAVIKVDYNYVYID